MKGTGKCSVSSKSGFATVNAANKATLVEDVPNAGKKLRQHRW